MEEEKKEKKFKILTLDKCPPCEKVKEILKKAGKDKDVEIINIASEEGIKFLMEGKFLKDEEGRLAVPFVIDEKNNVCELYFDEDIIIAKCGEEIKVIYDKEEEEKVKNDKEQ